MVSEFDLEMVSVKLISGFNGHSMQPIVHGYQSLTVAVNFNLNWKLTPVPMDKNG